MPVSPEKFYMARITHREDFSGDLWRITVDTGNEFRFVAGQYATLGVEAGGKLVERPYSIVSSPYEKEIEFFIELVPQGELTPLLYKLHSGDLLAFRKLAKGRFTLDLKSGKKNHLLLCTVTGIAPFVSYARTLYQDWKKNAMPADVKLFLINGASRSWEFGYRAEMEKLAAEVPWLEYVPTVSRPWEDAKWTRETGRVDDLIRKYSDQWGLSGADTVAYLCGHPQMIEHGEGILMRRRWPKDAVHIEVYFNPPKNPSK